MSEKSRRKQEDKTVIKKAQAKSNASRASLAKYGNRQNRDVDQLTLNAKKRMALTAAEDPFDRKRHLLPFTNGVMDLRTRNFRPIRKDDYMLISTGREWRPPSRDKVEQARQMFASMLPTEGPRKTLYSMLRGGLSAEPPELFFMLKGQGATEKASSWIG